MVNDTEKLRQGLAQLRTEAASLADQVGDLDAEITKLQAGMAADLSGVAPDQLLALARKKASANADLQALGMAREELERRRLGVEARATAAESALKVRFAERYQVELDAEAVEACRALAEFLRIAKPMLDKIHSWHEETGVTMQIAWSVEAIRNVENWLERAVKDRGLQL
jgi:hypothetical protein